MVTPNLTYAIDGTPGTGNIILGGTVGLDSSLYGDWTATLTALDATISQTTRAITAGTLALAKTLIIPITVTMTFTGANAGDLSVSPSGFTKSFTL